MQRTKEIADFLEANPTPSLKAFASFCDDRRRRWIDGNEQPPPMPLSIDEVDPRLRTPELEKAIVQRRIQTMLAKKGYSAFDLLTGSATVDILNELDPDLE
jgi:hypothetical protein